MRLNQFLARSGLGSRRSVEALILDGRVSVNGQIVRELARRVDLWGDVVSVDGRSLASHPPHEYLAFHKPAECDVTRGDRHARRTVYDLLPPTLPPSVQAVGRLDRATTGLLLLTDDGQLAYRLTHPRFGVPKTYRLYGERPPSAEQLARLRGGLRLEDGLARARDVRPFGPAPVPGSERADPPRPGLELTITLGRKRIVRRMCRAVGYELVALHRTQFGPIGLGPLARGKHRRLTAAEVRALRAAVGLEEPPAPGRSASRARGPSSPTP